MFVVFNYKRSVYMYMYMYIYFPPKLHIHLSEQKFKLNLAHLQNIHRFTKMSFKIRYFWGAR